MPDIKLKNGAGVEQTYTGVDTITVPLADGTGNHTFGLTDEDLTFDSGEFLFQGANKKNLEPYLSRIKIKPAKYNTMTYVNCNQMAYKDCPITKDYSTLVITIPEGTQYFFANTIVDQWDGQLLPTVVNNSPNCALFISLGNYNDELKQESVLAILNQFNRLTNLTKPSSSYSDVPSLMYRPIDSINLTPIFTRWQELLMAKESYQNYSSFSCLNYMDAQQYCESIFLPVPARSERAFTNNAFSTRSMPVTKDIIFATDNGTPYSVKWKSQIIDLSANSYGAGWHYTTMENKLFIIDGGKFKKSDNVCATPTETLLTTLEEAKARYNELKDTQYWFAASTKQISYNGKNCYLACLFSRYNHDSAVRTINSLPDTSAYLATAGGTNTIQFRSETGAETDGGAIGNLTDEEIAVATSKGWTVTLV